MHTTDNQEEIFDTVNEDDVVIGQATRNEVHSGSHLIHRSVGVIVFNRGGEMLLQQRSATKDTHPRTWTIACSGHVGTGDSYENAAHRELVEEIGTDMPITMLTKFRYDDERETELCALFVGYSEGPFTVAPAEVDQVKFFSKQSLAEALASSSIDLNPWGRLSIAKHPDWTSIVE